jgi:hypothetical protein
VTAGARIQQWMRGPFRLGIIPGKEDTKPMTNFYRTTLRPIFGGGVPPGVKWELVEAPADGSLTKRPDLPRSKHRYGVFTTDRPLTQDEMQHFDIEPVTVNRVEVWHYNHHDAPAPGAMIGDREVIRAAWRKHYIKVATCETHDFETAFRLTNNIDTSWSLEPDHKVTVTAPFRTAGGGRKLGHRSSMIGDVFVCDGKAKFVAMFGFEDLDNE